MKQTLSLIIFVVFFASCKKTTETTVVPSNNVKRLKASTTDNSRTSYTYDLLGKLSTVSVNGAVKEAYTYTPDGKIETMTINMEAISEVTSYVYKYAYNEAGLLTKRYMIMFNGHSVNINNEYTDFYYDSQNRRIAVVRKTNQGVADSTVLSDYDRGKARLVTRYFRENSGPLTSMYIYRYTYDDRLNVSKVESAADQVNPVFVFAGEYTYDSTIPMVLFNQVKNDREQPEQVYNTDFMVIEKSYSGNDVLSSTNITSVTQKDGQGYPLTVENNSNIFNEKTKSVTTYEWE